MSSSRSELEGRIRKHFQDIATGSVEAMLSDGIDRVNEDIETSLDPNRKERLEATREKLLEWQAQLASQPLLSSSDVTYKEAFAGGGDESSSRRSSRSCSSSSSSSRKSIIIISSSSGCSSSVDVVTCRPLVSSSCNEDLVLPRRPKGSTFGDKDGYLSKRIRGMCIYSKDGNAGEGGEGDGDGGSLSNSSILFVCDNGNHRVVAVDATSGTLIRTVYDDGIKGLELNNPKGICLLNPNTSDGGNNNSDEQLLLFIADCDNHRVQVVNYRTGALVGSIGGNGNGARNDQFKYPFGVAIGPSTSNASSEPLLFVTDCSNHRVQVFNAKTLAYVYTIGSGRGDGPGQLHGPYSICIGDVLSPSNKNGTSGYSTEYSIFVVDSNHRISVFNAASRSFLRTIGSGVEGSGLGQLKFPAGIYYLPAGAGSSNPNGDPHIYVADCFNHRVAIFNANSGAHVRHIDVGHFPMFLLPATTSDGDSFIYVGTRDEGLKIVYESNYARVIQLLFLLNHKIFDGFILNLDYELRDEVVESLASEML